MPTTFNQPSATQDGTPLLYDPSLVSVSWNGVSLRGFAPGTFIQVTRNKEAWVLYNGCTGAVARGRVRDDTGKAVVTVLAQHPTCDQLLAIATSDMVTWQQWGAFMVKDTNDQTVVSCNISWLAGHPAFSRGAAGDVVAFTFHLQQVQVTPANNLAAIPSYLLAE
jgi:hypothetical protein